MVAGMVVNVIWRFGIRFNFETMKEVHEVFPAFIISFFVYVIISKISVHRVPNDNHLALVFGKHLIISPLQMG